MTDPTDPTEFDASKKLAAENLAAIFDQYLLGDLAPHLSCTEANVLADFVEAYSDVETAQEFLARHAMSDEEEDLHYLDPDGKVHDRSDDNAEGTDR